LLTGVGSCWSGRLGQGGDAFPGGGDVSGPGPGGLDLEVALAAAAHQTGGGVQDAVASLNLEMIMVLGEADGGLRRA